MSPHSSPGEDQRPDPGDAEIEPTYTYMAYKREYPKVQVTDVSNHNFCLIKKKKARDF